MLSHYRSSCQTSVNLQIYTTTNLYNVRHEGPKGDKGDQGPQGPAGEGGSGGDVYSLMFSRDKESITLNALKNSSFVGQNDYLTYSYTVMTGDTYFQNESQLVDAPYGYLMLQISSLPNNPKAISVRLNDKNSDKILATYWIQLSF